MKTSLSAACSLVLLLLIAGCGANKAEKDIHPKLVRVRVMLEHGFVFPELENLVRSMRYDFELHRDAFSSGASAKCDDALKTVETIIDFSHRAAGGDVGSEYSELHEVGIYKTEKEFRADIRTYKDISALDAYPSARMIELQTQLNNATIELVFARERDLAVKKLKDAEAAT